MKYKIEVRFSSPHTDIQGAAAFYLAADSLDEAIVKFNMTGLSSHDGWTLQSVAEARHA